MGVIRVTTRPGYYAAMEAEEAIREPEVQEELFGLVKVRMEIGGLRDWLMTRQQTRIHEVMAKAIGERGKYVREYLDSDDRGYYIWPDFELHKNVLTTRQIALSEIGILEGILVAFDVKGWVPNDIIVTYYPEKRGIETLANLVTILESRKPLIEQALMLKEPMQIILNRGLAMSVSLSSFSFPAIEATAFLIAQACKMAISTRKARMNPCDMSNPKYQMRSWLLRLGFIGEQFERPRKTLLERLSGDMAFFNEEQKTIAVAKRKAKKMNDDSTQGKGA